MSVPVRRCIRAWVVSGDEAWRWDVEHPTAGGQGLGTAPIAREPVMAQALEAAGEHMQQEAPDELGGWEAHYLDRIALPIIAPAEVDDAVLQGHEALWLMAIRCVYRPRYATTC